MIRLYYDDGTPTTPEEILEKLAKRCGWETDVLLSIWMGGDLDGTILEAELESLHWLVCLREQRG